MEGKIFIFIYYCNSTVSLDITSHFAISVYVYNVLVVTGSLNSCDTIIIVFTGTVHYVPVVSR